MTPEYMVPPGTQTPGVDPPTVGHLMTTPAISGPERCPTVWHDNLGVRKVIGIPQRTSTASELSAQGANDGSDEGSDRLSRSPVNEYFPRRRAARPSTRMSNAPSGEKWT